MFGCARARVCMPYFVLVLAARSVVPIGSRFRHKRKIKMCSLILEGFLCVV